MVSTSNLNSGTCLYINIPIKKIKNNRIILDNNLPKYFEKINTPVPATIASPAPNEPAAICNPNPLNSPLAKLLMLAKIVVNIILNSRFTSRIANDASYRIRNAIDSVHYHIRI